MSNVISFPQPTARTCRCGAPGALVDVAHDGQYGPHIYTIIACEACLDTSMEQLSKVRPVFNAMIAADVPQPIANEVMSFLLEKLDPL